MSAFTDLIQKQMLQIGLFISISVNCLITDWLLAEESEFLHLPAVGCTLA